QRAGIVEGEAGGQVEPVEPDVVEVERAFDAASAHAVDVLHAGHAGADGDVGLRVQRIGDQVLVQRDAPVAVARVAGQGEVGGAVDFRRERGIVVDDGAGRDAALEQFGHGGVAHRLAPGQSQLPVLC